jgi:hypothetical protein
VAKCLPQDKAANAVFCDIPFLDLAGLVTPFRLDSTTDRTKRLFYRKEMDDLIKELNHIRQIFYVDGTPGVGKSWTVWAYIIDQFLENKRILWIHLNVTTRIHTCLALDPKHQSVWQLKTRYINEVLVDIANDTTADIVAIDGLVGTRNTILNLFGAANTNNKFRRAIHVASLAFSPKFMTKLLKEQLESGGTYGSFKMHPWTFEQYEQAISDKIFKDSIIKYFDNDQSLSTSLIDKYFYAGLSARWMFSITKAQVIQTIDDLLNRCDSETIKSLLNLDSNEGASTTVNSLTCQFQNNGIIRFYVSEYVTKAIARHINAYNIVKPIYVAAISNTNPALLGWAFELDFIAHCQCGLTLELCYPKGPDEAGEVEIVPLKYNLIKPIIGEITNLVTNSKHKLIFNEIVRGSWIQPHLFNQPGFDMSRVEKVNANESIYNIHFYQLTCANEHSLDIQPFMDHIKELLRVLKLGDDNAVIEAVSITFVVPRERIKHCNPGKLEKFYFKPKKATNITHLSCFKVGLSKIIKNWPTTDDEVSGQTKIAWFKNSDYCSLDK